MVRYTWHKPNPHFLPRQAGASPLFIYRPAHYLKPLHKKYSRESEESRRRGHGEAQVVGGAQPRRQPLRVGQSRPAHAAAVDEHHASRPPTASSRCATPTSTASTQNGLQLPYIDRFVLAVADPKLIPAKTGAGEADLQARDVHFNNYTFLKQGEKQNGYRTLLWRPGKGSHFALFPNLNVNDPVWRALLRDVRFRRALSLAIDRSLVNQVLYFGLAIESNNTVLPQSPLFREAYRDRWARYDRKKQASRLLDEMGLKKGSDGMRRLPDGRPLEIIVETAGETTEQTDVLELIRETWREVGHQALQQAVAARGVPQPHLFRRDRDVGVERARERPRHGRQRARTSSRRPASRSCNGRSSASTIETAGKSGEPVDIAEAKELQRLYNGVAASGATRQDRERAWHAMLELHAEQQFTIGIVSGVPQPVVARETLMNVPEKGFYNWDPGRVLRHLSPRYLLVQMSG